MFAVNFSNHRNLIHGSPSTRILKLFFSLGQANDRWLAGEEAVSVGVDTLITWSGRPSPGEVLVS